MNEEPEPYEIEAHNALVALSKAIKEGFGDKCEEYEIGCPVCDVWHYYDGLE